MSAHVHECQQPVCAQARKQSFLPTHSFHSYAHFRSISGFPRLGMSAHDHKCQSHMCSSAHASFSEVSAQRFSANSLILLIRSFQEHFWLSTIRHERSWPFTPMTFLCLNAHPVFLKVSALFPCANLLIPLMRSFGSTFG